MFTYEDLQCHQDILKNLMKVAEPNLYCCYVWGTNDFCDLYAVRESKQIANIFLGIREKPGNFTTRNVAAIHADGHVQTDCLTDQQRQHITTWLSFIEPQQKRYDHRISLIKDELLAVCYHPDNVKKLIPFSRN